MNIADLERLPWFPTTAGAVEFDVSADQSLSLLTVDGMITACAITRIWRDGAVLCIAARDGVHQFTLRSPVAKALLKAFPDGKKVNVELNIEQHLPYLHDMEENKDQESSDAQDEQCQLQLKLSIGQLMYLHALLISNTVVHCGLEHPAHRRVLAQKVQNAVCRAVSDVFRFKQTIEKIRSSMQMPSHARAVLKREQQKIDALASDAKNVVKEYKIMRSNDPNKTEQITCDQQDQDDDAQSSGKINYLLVSTE